MFSHLNRNRSEAVSERVDSKVTVSEATEMASTTSRKQQLGN